MTGHFKIATAAAVYVYDAAWVAIAPPAFSDAFWVAVATGVPATIAATGAMIVSLRNSRKSDKIIEKAVEIHTLTNSNLSKVTASLETANSKITGLERLVAAMVASNEATLMASNLAEAATEKRAEEAAAVAAAASLSTPPR